MYNEYDISAIHKNKDESPSITNTKSTKLNVFVAVIPEETRNIIDFTFLTAGVTLNILLILVILINFSRRTTTDCYVISLVLSNLLILLQPLHQVLTWILEIYMMINFDYIFLISFYTSVLTIVLLNIETYVEICHKRSHIRERLLKVKNAIKGVIIIWIACIMLTSTELHMYDIEGETMYDIYIVSTIIFLLFPCVIFAIINFFIIYDLTMMKKLSGSWQSANVYRFAFLFSIIVGFFFFMVPYRAMKTIEILTPSCCNELAVEVAFIMVTIYPIIMPITCFIISRKYRQAFGTTLLCRRHKISNVP